MSYSEDEMLMLSGIQHFVFCSRQWALIHIEQQWADNVLTTEGDLLHKNVDNPAYRQKNGDTITLRSMAIASKKLGLYGFADAIELKPTDNALNAIQHPRYAGYWMPIPIEYKRGKAKTNRCDEVQAAAQAMCLEEMYNIQISQCMLYYGSANTRKVIELEQPLREYTQACANEMHRIYRTGQTPQAEWSPRCQNCSIKDICMPKIQLLKHVEVYLKKELYAETT